MAWLLRCERCALRASRLDQPPFDHAELGGWNTHNATALAPLREATARRLLRQFAAVMPLADAHVLDVGCGPGWFLREAAQYCRAATGIEPDAAVAERARAAGLDVVTGAFPADLPHGPFDLVTFNDVFEHLADPVAAVRAARTVLAPGGLLALNLPSSRGLFYRTAEWLARAGYVAPLERVWQKGFESPHLYYYRETTLDAVLARHGFHLQHAFTLPTLAIRGLWYRINEGRTLPPAAAGLVYLASVAALALSGLLPADIIVRIYRLEANRP